MADDDRIVQLRQQLIPAKDAAVQATLAQWEAGEKELLPLVTSMQQELTAMQEELASLQACRVQAEGKRSLSLCVGLYHRLSQACRVQTEGKRS